MAETERDSSREATLEGLDAAARKGKDGVRPRHHRRHAAPRAPPPGERRVRRTDPPEPDHPTGKRKGRNPGLAGSYRGLAEHEKRQAYPEAVAQAHADFDALQAEEIQQPQSL
ncbi:hypothetical protein OG936_11405 [Streptomyces sp. NBC_00846]|uniref:hypothetical protein n=1 Tax=Streptomyces sp. NBC_00846 TaxID=2975849 RepID=UPI00386C1DAB|nr:hypothetical protein OG936_11405 [Streptomyces sp. NBC_00846]